ncbi:16S rRNA (uracil(1498)-N(3))-methyltransferase [Ramlibacter montanisoli]|uniref:Ribosomal RNA small subunit methyltransferase E n=1 Tax=Ramlibacter montanisoli TaxID=2732512 RepID=A0A849KH91_9BURK|nr:16S rRNA (uracil(1498)-N(3))-methyltransferase [Ramlibacter montanisoli]NNU44806.1 16S rRNA (uracil(1498)-N(3))-methyltransferase [Ramlibacter montanisoli]
MPRLHCAEPLASGARLALPAGTARHVQVLRMQPGEALTLFDGRGGAYDAVIEHMGRSEVRVAVGAHHAVECEAPVAVHLALAMPANERMDWLVEKATELGAASIQPLVAERSVLRLAGERAQKKQAHWQAVAIAACEQCGRNRVPVVHAVQPLAGWLASQQQAGLVLSLREGSRALAAVPRTAEVTLLSGPEGGLSPAEEDAAFARGWQPVNLGPRVLRAETAPLAALAILTLAGAMA